MAEQRLSGTIECTHCGNRAPMRIIAKHSRVRSYSNVDVPVAWDEGPFWELLECPTCDGILLRKGYWHEVLSDESGPDYELLYPAVRELIRGLPEEIKKAYDKAMRVRTIDSNAFAVLLGRVLDLVCIDKKAEGESLFDRLKYISDKNVMRSSWQTWHMRYDTCEISVHMLTSAS